MFLSTFNELFDMCNGLHRTEWIQKHKPNLKPYTSDSDEEEIRYKKFEAVLQYLQNWKKEVHSLPNLSLEKKNSMLLPQQTQDGWEMVCRGFPALMKFLIQNGTKYVMGRVVSQDPEEQQFGKHRAKDGPNRASDQEKFARLENSIHLQGNLPMKRRGANTESVSGTVDVDTPLPKRKKPASCRSIFPALSN